MPAHLARRLVPTTAVALTFARRLVPTTAVALTLGGLSVGAADAHVSDHGSDHRVVGHVYEPTNASGGNAIQVFDRFADGRLAPAGAVATGGTGTGASLHSQGGVVRDGDLLFVVNGGDGSVSALEITSHGLVLRSRLSSHGTMPVSVTVRRGVGYVVNQGSDTISGFRYSHSGHLSAVAGSTRALTPNPAGGITDAAQVSFTPDGSSLLVTEKASNTLDTFAVWGGYAAFAVAHPSAGVTPYGFDFDRRGDAIVSEATTGSASSYAFGRKGLNVISSAVGDTQSAACWLVVHGGYAYAVNAASGTVSSYVVAENGSLTLRAAVAATTGAGGTDASVSADGRSLHVRMGGGVISSWSIGRDGSLTALGTIRGAAAFGPAGLATS